MSKPLQLALATVVTALLLTSTTANSTADTEGLDAEGSGSDTVITVGSKKFTEAVLLGDIATLTIRARGLAAVHRRQLGGTRVLWNALRAGEIDAYPEYTGTIRKEILAGTHIAPDLRSLADALAAFQVSVSRPLGFANNYALGMREDTAARAGIRNISDLRGRTTLRMGFNNEFMDRADGWPGLMRTYRLSNHSARGLDHDLAYKAMVSGGIDVMDLYTTDAEIAQYGLRILRDDRGYFSNYDAVILYRSDLAGRWPVAVAALQSLADTISEPRMIEMNAAAKIKGVPELEVARRFVTDAFGIDVSVQTRGRLSRVLLRTREHLWLVGVSMTAAVLVALPLGIVAARNARVGHAMLAVAGVVQTIPALAVLVFMIPALGIGGPPAIVALFLYSLLPILRNTHAGLRGIPASLIESADVLGLTPNERLRWIELPLASPSILAGIKTSAVINIGTATLGALIGAGGFGQPILTGIRLDNMALILEGAIPAAALALVVQVAFEAVERVLVPAGLRITAD